VADITQQRTGEGWLYVAVVLDCFSRRIVGWSMAEHLRTELVLDALDMAIAQRQPGAGLIHHSDHGCQTGFKGSMQHRLVGWRVAARSGLRLGSSNRGSCGAGC
jgi:transposase InsO family protein